MNNDIKQLNTALKGEHMAVESFDHYIHDATDDTLRQQLQGIQQTHRTHASQLSVRIQQLGGNPVNTAGIAGAVAEVKMRISPKKYIDNNLLKSAIKGEEMGTKAYSNIISQLSDSSNKELAQGMLAENQGIIEELSKQLTKFPMKP
jgi:bacterioferritin